MERADTTRSYPRGNGLRAWSMTRNSKRPESPAKRRRATRSISTERSTSVIFAAGNVSATTALSNPVPAPRSSTRSSSFRPYGRCFTTAP